MGLSDRHLAIHGGGYVGLTGAVHFAKAGWRVVIYDPDQATVRGINAGTPRAGDFLSYLDTDVARLVAEGRLAATTSWDAVTWIHTHVVAVPTERAGEPDDAIVLDVLRRLLRDVAPESTILVESTLTPGTMDKLLTEFVHPQTPDAPPFGSVHVAVCPRRDWFADPTKNLATLPRVVGGVTAEATSRAITVLATVSDEILGTTYRTAEIVKALENALLHIPVVFAHQLAVALPDHDVAEALRLVSTHWRFQSMGQLYLGFGTGGRCVPLGSRYLTEAAHELKHGLTIAEEASLWDGHLRYVIARLVADNRWRSAAVLGIAYRPEFKDAGRSPGLDVARELGKLGVDAAVHDPLWTAEELGEFTNLPVLRPSQLSDFDAVLLATPHRFYADWPMAGFWRRGQHVLDGQGAWAPQRERFIGLGVDYRRVGEAGWMRTS